VVVVCLLCTALGLLVATLLVTMNCTSVRVVSGYPATEVADRLPPSIGIETAPEVVGEREAPEWLANLRHDVERTGLFEEVLAGEAARSADILMRVRYASKGGVCGMPLMLNALTFGLVPGWADHSRFYEFELVDARTGNGLRCHARYRGPELYGIWSIPAQRSAEYCAPSEIGAPDVFVPFLRSDLAMVVTAIENDATDEEVGRWEPRHSLLPYWTLGCTEIPH
jgi:hypothetical protein